MHATCAIAVMAKAPRAGRCKTRLVPPLRPEDAAKLSAAFLRDVTENITLAARAQAIAGYIAYAPRGLEHLFDGHLAAGTGRILADGSIAMPDAVQNFGRCLLHAIDTLLAQHHAAAIVLNSDSPNLPTEYLEQAAEILAQPGDRAVIGPAVDGGYYLLGLKTPHARMFEDIVWSTGTVAETTIRRAGEIGLDIVALPTWYDVDDAASLARLFEDFAQPAGGAYHAPATRACLAALNLHGPAALKEQAW